MIRDPFPSLDHIGGVEEPLVILHGTDDTRVPSSMSQALLAATPGQKEIIRFPCVGRIDLFGPDLWVAETRFIARQFFG